MKLETDTEHLFLCDSTAADLFVLCILSSYCFLIIILLYPVPALQDFFQVRVSLCLCVCVRLCTCVHACVCLCVNHAPMSVSLSAGVCTYGVAVNIAGPDHCELDPGLHAGGEGYGSHDDHCFLVFLHLNNSLHYKIIQWNLRDIFALGIKVVQHF